MPTLTNSEIAEWLSSTGETAEGERRRIYRRAAHAALAWPEAAADIHARGDDLTKLYMVGPRLSRRIAGWLESDDPPPEPPPSRRGFMDLARARALAASLDPPGSDLQMHSEHSDGGVSVEEMARAAAALGHDYIAITDHSEGLKIARGMSPGRLAAQVMEVAALNEELSAEGDFRVLQGLEMNIDVRGNGDMPAESVRSLDLVLGSFHSALRVTDDQTARYVKAVSNPYVDVLGHPRGRRFGARSGLNADWERVFRAAADSGVAIEVNSHPHRQDLEIDLLRVARNFDVWFTIGTDAHSPAELEHFPLGIAALHLAEIPRDRVLNHLSADALLAWIMERRRTRAKARR